MKKCWHHLVSADVISFLLTKKCQKNPKNWRQLEEVQWIIQERCDFLQYWKSQKKQGITLTLEHTFLEKPQGGSLSLSRVNIINGVFDIGTGINELKIIAKYISCVFLNVNLMVQNVI